MFLFILRKVRNIWVEVQLFSFSIFYLLSHTFRVVFAWQQVNTISPIHNLHFHLSKEFLCKKTYFGYIKTSFYIRNVNLHFNPIRLRRVLGILLVLDKDSSSINLLIHPLVAICKCPKVVRRVGDVQNYYIFPNYCGSSLKARHGVQNSTVSSTFPRVVAQKKLVIPSFFQTTSQS